MLNFDVPDLYVKDYKNIFPGKQEALLKALESAEIEHGKDIPIKLNKSKLASKRRISTKSFRNQESIFKVPEVPFKVGDVRRIMSARSAVRRGNWVKYDLSNVDEMSDSSNAQAAFSFLKELEDRKCNETELEDIDSQNFKPVFKKRYCPADSGGIVNVQSTKKYSAVMRKTQTEVTCRNNSVSNTIKLNHLNFDDDSE